MTRRLKPASSGRLISWITREELRAATADLRHLQGFLAAIARSPEEAALSPDDTTLADLAGRHALAVAALAVALEQALG